MGLFCCMLICCLGYAQKGFQIDEQNDLVSFPFSLVANNIIIPVSINGTSLNFIVDSGSNRTIIFDFNDVDTLLVKQGKIIEVKGYGSSEPLKAIESKGNVLDIYGLVKAPNEDVLVMLDSPIALSELIGYPVNGILGVSFFKNYLVDFNFVTNTITLHRSPSTFSRKLRNAIKIPMSYKYGQPHIKGVVENEGGIQGIELLLDTGNSDAMWINDIGPDIDITDNYFNDFLGLGVSGDVYGKRSKLDKLTLGDISIKKIASSHPDKDNLLSAKRQLKNYGSLGVEVFRRFYMVFDFIDNWLYLKPNNDFSEGFYYNMAGIELRAEGFELKSAQELEEDLKKSRLDARSVKVISFNTENKTNRFYKPKLYIRSVRQGSQAYQAGLKEGDQIVRVNSLTGSQLSLQRVSDVFHSKPHSKVTIVVLRGEERIKKTFKLLPLIN